VLCCVALGWVVVLGWVGLRCAVLCWVALGWVGLGWVVEEYTVDSTRLEWTWTLDLVGQSALVLFWGFYDVVKVLVKYGGAV
jgi:hypothetical protein